jgi:tripartite-type tricarboxylate transporter receptor subunit TctC
MLRVRDTFLRATVRCLAALMLLGVPAPASAQQYPAKPVRIIVPFAAGGPVDVVARLVAQKLSEKLGQQFLIENQVGAGGNAGMGNAARAPADGYTVLFVSSSYVVNPSLYAKIPYDPYRDLIPITVAGDIANTLIVHDSVPVRSVKELIAVMMAQQGKYNN